MCGRFVLAPTDADFEELFEISAPAELAPRFNIAPSQDVLTVTLVDGARTASFRRWGLVPSWAKETSIGNKLINARAETVAEKPSFRSAYKRRRCLVPMSGFYEWKRDGKAKQPYFIRTRDPLFAVAGLFERWERPNEVVESCTLLTTRANAAVGAIHERMPVIVPRKLFSVWLDPDTTSADDLASVLAAYPADEMATQPVSRRVNSPAEDGPELTRAV
jgi:putative SOS response-associated peptidase YedK